MYKSRKLFSLKTALRSIPSSIKPDFTKTFFETSFPSKTLAVSLLKLKLLKRYLQKVITAFVAIPFPQNGFPSQ